MANLTENSKWEDGIYQLERTDPVEGGAPDLAKREGIDNVAPQQLANRTLFLKSLLETLQQSLAALTNGAPDGLNTLSAVASALGGNPNFSATIANEISGIKTTLSNLTSGAPGTLDSFNELAAALGDDPNFATTILGELASLKTKVAQADPIGRPILWITRTPPPNHLFLQGQDLLRSSYPKLMAFVNDNASDIYDPTGAEKGKFRPGSSSATFRLPDMRDRYPVGGANSSNVLKTHDGSSMAREVALSETNSGIYNIIMGAQPAGYFTMQNQGSRHATRILNDGSTTLRGNNEGNGPDSSIRTLWRFLPPSVTVNIAIRYA